MHEELARAAAKWWADKLRGKRVFDAMGHSLPDYHERAKVDDPTGHVRLLEMALNITQEEIALEKCDAFEEHLYDMLVHGYDWSSSWDNDTPRTWHERGFAEGRSMFRLSVDYGPDMTLGRAAERAGIETHMTTFPLKTSLIVDAEEGTIIVSEGYGAEWKTIFGEVPVHDN